MPKPQELNPEEVRCGERTSDFILILNYNGGRDTLRCLDSLQSDSIELRNRVIVVDNGSTDSSLDIVRLHSQGVEIIRHPRNLGFAEGYNVVIRRLMREGAESVLLLNNDTVIRPGSYSRMLADLRSDRTVGAVGPAIIDMGSSRIQSAGAIIRWKRGGPILRYRGYDYDAIPSSTEEVDYVSGSAILIGRRAIERAGFFPQHFFMYGEDSDLCLRMRKCGLRVVCDPLAIVEHKEESTSSRYPGLKARLMTRNRILLAKRHASTVDFIIFSIRLMFLDAPLTTLRLVCMNRKAGCLTHGAAGVLNGFILAFGEKRVRS